MFIYGISVFILGLIIGSFLNVVILRYNTGKSLGGRSGCLSCNSKLTSETLIPVLSYLLLKGKCKNCQSKISIQYPLVELFTAILFVATYMRFEELIFSNFLVGSLNIALFLIVFSILVIVLVYDLKHKIIPNELSYTLAILALIYRIIVTPFGNLDTLLILDLLSGLILFIPFFLLWFISKGKWIGLGDGKLVLSIGWFLGFIYSLSGVVLAFWIGAVFSLTLMLIAHLKERHSHITMKTEIPFAPFLIIGFIIMFFYPIDVLGLSLLLF